jgi:hypothetical protein
MQFTPQMIDDFYDFSLQDARDASSVAAQAAVSPFYLQQSQ